ncbi:MAG TPA: hypothetical protein PLW47_03540, partial [Sphaerochaeta sp.]|nr:hypothetical protein [Sphaerochaeta sp.]
MTPLEKLANAKRFDMKRNPIPQRHYLRPLTWLLSYPEVWLRRLTITRRRMEGIKPPFLLLCTHMAFIDFKVTTAALFPHRANYVVAIDGFIGREWLLRNAGGICKRKFTNDLQVVRHIKEVLHSNGDVLALYPEARYSLCGTTAVLPDSLGKICKLLGVPVVMLNMHGHYLNSPVWNLKKRGVPIASDLFLIADVKETESLSVDELNARIRSAFEYDEYRWQKENRIAITFKKRAEGLHKILYQCAHCHTEYEMYSFGSHIACRACRKEWEMGIHGELSASKPAEDETVPITEFSHIPDWYEWERSNVRREIEEGTYTLDVPVMIEALPNARGYIPIGMGRLVHDMNGFTLETEGLYLHKDVSSMYSCHIEYEYKGKG